MAIKRIQSEFMHLMRDSHTGCVATPLDPCDLFHWEAMIFGCEGTSYQGGIFLLDIVITEDYPFKPPKVKFITKVFHPNIDSQGNISLDIFQKEWSPSMTIEKVIISINSLLSDPNPDDPLEPEIAELYKTDREKYEATVREWTKKYAV